MAKKLTLRMDEEVIKRAKAYAAERGISVSKLVEQYFEAVTANGDKDGVDRSDDWKEDLTPFTRRLIDREPSSGDVDEEDYYRYLEEKHR
jgi:hypothetical protein